MPQQTFLLNFCFLSLESSVVAYKLYIVGSLQMYIYIQRL